jgi:assimilatory nitrate reductase catalytic subunit
MPERTVKTTCPYCGVGCGVQVSIDENDGISVKGDPDHPANLGRLCSKGAALADTLDHDNRLLHPQIGAERVSWDTALDHVAERFRSVMAQHGPEAVAFYVSGQLLTEDYYVANKLMKGYIGTAMIDTNSRLCMASSVAGHWRAFGADSVPCCYEDLEQAALIVLTGSNAAWCHPVLFQRIRKAKQNNPKLRVVVIDPRRTATCDIADLHIPLKPGSDVALFNGLLLYLYDHSHLNERFVSNATQGLPEAIRAAREDGVDVAQRCGVKTELVERFFQWFAETEQVVTVYSQGVNQSSAGTDKVNSIINCHLLTGRIGKPGSGPFSFTGQPNAMGGREVGGLANQLAAHMRLESQSHRESVQGFWSSPRIAQRPGLKAVDLFDAVERGKVKAVWIMATNPAVSLPDANRVRAALEHCEFVVVSDCVAESDTNQYADVLLPAATWGEKEGTVTNSERRISRQRAFLPPPGEARADWWIVTQVARRMGFAEAFGYESSYDIFTEHAALSGHDNHGQRAFDISGLSGLSRSEYEQLSPVQWPVTAQQSAGTMRLFSDTRFYTPSAKAQFIATATRPPVNATDEPYPLILNTGRVRDHWHTLTRTAKSVRLSQHDGEPFIQIHPEDALRFAVHEGELAQLNSRWGSFVGRVKLDAGMRRGEVFAPMHWSDQFTSQGRADGVVNPVVDPISGEPEFKFTPVNITAYATRWRAFALSRAPLNLGEVDYWCRIKGDQHWHYQCAGQQPVDDWQALGRRLLANVATNGDWMEFQDRRTGRYRCALMQGQQLQTCLFVEQDAALPSSEWLASLFSKAALNPTERTSLLSGSLINADFDSSPLVCSCFQVRRQAIIDAIEKEGLSTEQAIGDRLKAGTNCGSCLPEIRGLLESRGASDGGRAKADKKFRIVN